jgi:ribosomal protein L24E
MENEDHTDVIEALDKVLFVGPAPEHRRSPENTEAVLGHGKVLLVVSNKLAEWATEHTEVCTWCGVLEIYESGVELEIDPEGSVAFFCSDACLNSWEALERIGPKAEVVK